MSMIVQQYWDGRKEDYGFIPVRDLAQAFTQTQTHQRSMELMDSPFKPQEGGHPKLDPLVRSRCAIWSDQIAR